MDDHQACWTGSRSAPEPSQVAGSGAASFEWVCLFRSARVQEEFDLPACHFVQDISSSVSPSPPACISACLWKLTALPMDRCRCWWWWRWGCGAAAAVREWECSETAAADSARSSAEEPQRRLEFFFVAFSFSFFLLTSLFHTLHEEVRVRRWGILRSSQCVLVKHDKGNRFASGGTRAEKKGRTCHRTVWNWEHHSRMLNVHWVVVVS